MKNILKNSLGTRRVLKQIAFASMFIPSLASAGTLYITNETTSDLTLLVEPGEGGTGQYLQYTISAKGFKNSKKNISITSKEFGEETNVISITGKATMPSVNNKCSGLFVNKDYKIVFVDGTMGGVVCHSTKK